MADKRPLFINGTYGYQEEMALTDEIQLGKVTINAAGTGIVMNSKPITGLPDTPPQGDAAVNKNYVDAVAQGLAVKTPVVVTGTVADGDQSLSGLPILDGVSTLLEADRVLLTHQTNAIQNGIWLVHGARASLDLATKTTNCNSVVEARVSGASSVTLAFVADGTGVGTLNRATNAFTFHYETAVTTVANFEAAVAALAGADKLIQIKTPSTSPTNTLAVTVDEFTSTGLSGGSSSAWTRPADFAAGAHAMQAFVFVEAGDIFSDTGWVCTTNYPNDVIGTNTLAWVQFSSAGVITASHALTKVGNDIQAKPGDGIDIVTNDRFDIRLSATNPCLALVGTSGVKSLEAQIVTAGTGAGGLEKTSTGLQLLLDGTTLKRTASGVSVLGLPPDFEISGTATHFDDPGTGAGKGQVTAANLDTLTAGSASVADSLHTHTGISVDSAGRVQKDYTVNEAVAAGDPLFWSTSNDRVERADTVDPKAFVMGVAKAAQPTSGNTVAVVSLGLITGLTLPPSTVAGDPIYVANGGGLARALPTGAKRVIRVGFAKNTTDLFVMVADYGKKAA